MNWSAIIDNVVLPLAVAAVGWFGRRYLSSERRAVAAELGERWTRYALAAADGTLVAMEAGHVRPEAVSLLRAWRARFVALSKAAGFPASRAVQVRAAGKAARELVRQLGGKHGERAAQLAAVLEAVVLAGGFVDE